MDDLIDDPTPGANTPEFSVSEISGAVKRALEDRFGRVRVRGEVGRTFRARSGHLYFDVKDDRSVLACVSWKGQLAQLSVVPEEGMEVVVTGRLTTFGSQSKYQMNVEEVAVAGQGALLAMLEKRRAQLAAEGLFDAGRKRPLPFLPNVIGVVTSPQGAVIRDILHRLRDRFPRHVVIWPVAVQGKACAPEVARAIRGFDALAPGGPVPRPDVVIVARGGGSVEDLWGFNEEAVVRAAAECTIPLISAVGHETDTTLIDHASDRRAPTPTAAAEIAVPVRLDLLADVDAFGARQARAVRALVAARRQRLGDLGRGLPRVEALLSAPAQRLDHAAARLPSALRGRVSAERVRLSRLEGKLSPATLAATLRERRARLSSLSARLDAALPRRAERARDRLDRMLDRLSATRHHAFGRPRDRLARIALRPGPLARQAAEARGRLDRAVADLRHRALTRQDRLAARVAALDRQRESLGYKATLARGFAVVRDGGAIVTSADAARAARSLEIEFADEQAVPVTVGTPTGGGTPPPGDQRPATPRRSKSRPPIDDAPEQGTLL